ncbi:MAG: hypothetical protein U1D30_13835 [Planctomycetota bacterium]
MSKKLANKGVDWAKNQAAAVVDFGTDAAKDLGKAFKSVEKEVSALGNRIQKEVLGPLATGSFIGDIAEALGFGGDRSRDPSEYVRRTFEAERDGFRR